MRRILLIGLLVAIVCLLMTQSPNPTIMVWVPIEPHLDVAYVANAQRGVRVTAHAAVLLESTSGTVLYAHNEHIHRAPASITKVMTALLPWRLAVLTILSGCPSRLPAYMAPQPTYLRARKFVLTICFMACCYVLVTMPL